MGERRRAAMEKHVITGEVGLRPVFLISIRQTLLRNTTAKLFSPDSASSASSGRPEPRWKSALYWLCGMERRKQGDSNPPPPPAPEQASLEEKPRLQLIVNVNLIISLSVTAFIIGYWA